jgi:CubicO group peptidase (beta-lactamase class C family)
MAETRRTVMFRAAVFIMSACLLAAPSTILAQVAGSAATNASPKALPSPPEFPGRFDWLHKKPEEVGMDAVRLDEAVKYAVAHENPATKDMKLYLATTFGAKEPLDTPIGFTKDRGSANGLIIRHGSVVAEWDDPKRVDMTFSVTKSFLTTVVGLAWQRGLIHDVNDYVRDYMPAGVDLFEAPHNQLIKWDDLLRQTSDWQGTLWGKPDWADRPEGDNPTDWPNRKLWEPGTHYKYNDVRVNVLALAALNVWRRPLQEVLREEVMEPTQPRCIDHCHVLCNN